MIRTELDTYGARVAIETMWQAAESVRRGALTDSLMGSAYRISEQKFHAFVLQNGQQPDVDKPGGNTGGKFAHVFEYGSGTSPGMRLYDVFMVGGGKSRVVTYKFFKNRSITPQPTMLRDFYTMNHVFVEKATVLENADPIKIDPVNSPVMVYYRPGAKHSDEDGVVFKKSTSNIDRAGGGKYDANFAEGFLAWWMSEAGVQGDLTRLANRMDFNAAFREARGISAAGRVASASARAGNKDAAPEARRNAKKMMETIKKQMTKTSRSKFL